MWYTMWCITWYIIYQVIYLIYHMIWYGCGQVWNNTAVCACWALDTSCGMPSAPTSNTYRSLRTCISLLFSPDTGVVAVAHPHTPMSWLGGCTWQTKKIILLAVFIKVECHAGPVVQSIVLEFHVLEAPHKVAMSQIRYPLQRYPHVNRVSKLSQPAAI